MAVLIVSNISGGSNRSQWEDITGSAPVNLVKDCVSFSTTVSARSVTFMHFSLHLAR